MKVEIRGSAIIDPTSGMKGAPRKVCVYAGNLSLDTQVDE